MLKINSKEIVHSATFTLEPGEKAVMTPAQLPGATIVIQMVTKSDPTSNDIKIETAQNTATVTIPFLQSSSLSTDMHLGDMRQGKLGGRLVGQAVSGGMLLHMDFYLTDVPSFAPR